MCIEKCLKQKDNNLFRNEYKDFNIFLIILYRAMKKEDNSEQGKIVTELLQHLHGCKGG